MSASLILAIVKEAFFLLLAFLDAEFTKRKIGELGIEIELNPLVRMLVKWFGIEYGVGFGVVVPTGLLAIAGWYFPNILSFLIGVRFCLFLFQQRIQNGE